jgi:hypothetical protein
MRSLLFLIAMNCFACTVFSQYVYTIKADTVKITNCDSAELVLQNHTQGVPGFLFNAGNGRTVFQRGAVRLNDSMYLIGADTLKVLGINANNGTSLSGSTVQLGGDLVQNTTINQHQDSLVLVTPDGSTFVEQDSASQPVILPGNNDFGEIPMVKRSKRTGFVVEDNAVAINAATNPDQNFLYSRQVTDDWFPSGVTSAAFGSSNSFFSELIQGTTTGTVLNWHVAGPSSFRGRTWNNWITLVNQNNSFYGGNIAPFVAHFLPLYITPAKNAYYSFSSNAMAAGATFAVDADALPLYFVDMPGIPLDTVNNKLLVINPTTGAVQYSYWPSFGSTAASGNVSSSLAVNGPIKAQRLTLFPADWPDYVFDSSYRLPALPEVEYFIRQQHHLPGVASAAEVQKDGADVGDVQTVMLKKIEELTLYAIDQDKKLDEQQKALVSRHKEMQNQQSEIELLKAEVEMLKKAIKNIPEKQL